MDHQLSRRQFGQSLALASAGLALTSTQTPARDRPETGIKLGFDNFAVRGMQWKAPALIDYAVALKLDSLFITDLDAFERFDDAYLGEIRRQAADHGLQLHVGTWSICPTSNTFKTKWGSAEEHLALGIRVARALGSPVIRVILGNGEDRKGPGGIERHIASTVAVCKRLRRQAVDANVKIAVENHAGDMHSSELVGLVEQAGRDYVGVNIDSGNALWAMEDPLDNLERLGPYVATTSLRDGAVWEYDEGAKVQWTAMGEGQMDLKRYFRRFAELCPGVPVHIETISGFARPIPYLTRNFWDAWPKLPAREFAHFLALAKHGKPPATVKAPPGKTRQESEQLAQKGEIERSLRYCKEVLGLGLKRCRQGPYP